MDYRRNSSHSVAARLFRSEHQPKVPSNRQLDPYADRYRRHTRHIAPPWGVVNLSRFDDLIGLFNQDPVRSLALISTLYYSKLVGQLALK